MLRGRLAAFARNLWPGRARWYLVPVGWLWQLLRIPYLLLAAADAFTSGSGILNRASFLESVQGSGLLGQFTAGRVGYWLHLTPRRSSAFCWMGVGLVTTVSG